MRCLIHIVHGVPALVLVRWIARPRVARLPDHFGARSSRPAFATPGPEVEPGDGRRLARDVGAHLLVEPVSARRLTSRLILVTVACQAKLLNHERLANRGSISDGRIDVSNALRPCVLEIVLAPRAGGRAEPAPILRPDMDRRIVHVDVAVVETKVGLHVRRPWRGSLASDGHHVVAIQFLDEACTLAYPGAVSIPLRERSWLVCQLPRHYGRVVSVLTASVGRVRAQEQVLHVGEEETASLRKLVESNGKVLMGLPVLVLCPNRHAGPRLSGGPLDVRRQPAAPLPHVVQAQHCGHPSL